MTSEIIMPGPIDNGGAVTALGQVAIERRSIKRIQEELATRGFTFNFGQHLSDLTKTFPEADTINILDSGCGFQKALRNIKTISNKLQIPTFTVGVTQNENHVPKNQDHPSNADLLIIGSVQEAHIQGLLDQKFHFILDFYGATYYDNPFDGATTLPVYSDLLVPGGTVLFVSENLIEDNPFIQWRQNLGLSSEISRDELLQFVDQCDFNILRLEEKYSWVQKRY